jgi:hypothetical protein
MSFELKKNELNYPIVKLLNVMKKAWKNRRNKEK